MANSFTNILPILTKAAQVISRESCGILRAVNLDASPQGVNIGATINLPKAPAATASDWSPSLSPTLTDTTATGKQLTLSLAKKSSWHVTAEQAAAMNKGDATALKWYQLQAEQAIRIVANTIESYLFGLAYKASSRAVGTAGTTPFASSLAAASQVGQILDENGAPASGRSLVLNPAAFANLRALFANIASTEDRGSFRAGLLPDISGLIPQMSNQIAKHTKGTGTGYLINNGSGEVAGETTLTLDTGSGTILAGDVLTHASDTVNKYIVGTALAANDVVINDPGLLVTAANDDAVTVGNTYTPNLAMTQDALYAVVRPPLQDADLRIGEQVTIMDPISGISMGVYKQVGDGVTHYSVRAVYGGVVMESRHIATLLG